MTAAIVTFADALAAAKGTSARVSILLGNGFSQALHPEFGYGRLRDVAQMDQNLTVTQDKLFEHAASDDFETVIQHLEQSARLIQLYNPTDTKLSDALLADAHVVKKGLVEALASVHPASARSVDDRRYVAVRSFLSSFTNIFTLNYDLLLYWAINQDELHPQVAKADGFRRPDGVLTWRYPGSEQDQTVFFLHGAVHLYTDDHEVRKLSGSVGTIVQQLRSNLSEGRYPLVVTEGSRANKQTRIAQNPYLAYCHRRLGRLGGALFIHGVALSDNDQHISDAISEEPGHIEALYVGLHGPRSAARNKVQLAAEELAETCAAKSGRTTSLTFYHSESASVWAAG